MRWVAGLLLGLYSVFVAKLTLADPTFLLQVSGGGLSPEQEALANVALFVPAGFLGAVLLGRPLVAAVLCALASTCIELAQQRYFPSRVPTLADVQHNGLGGLLGALLAWPFSRSARSPW